MIETPVQMRFADVDMLGHVNNVNQQFYFDIGKIDFFERVIDLKPYWREVGVITVSIHSDYLAQIKLNENIAIRTWIGKVGSKSFTVEQQIVNLDTGEVKTTGSTVLVAFNFVSQESVSLPEGWRNRLTEQLK